MIHDDNDCEDIDFAEMLRGVTSFECNRQEPEEGEEAADGEEDDDAPDGSDGSSDDDAKIVTVSLMVSWVHWMTSLVSSPHFRPCIMTHLLPHFRPYILLPTSVRLFLDEFEKTLWPSKNVRDRWLQCLHDSQTVSEVALALTSFIEHCKGFGPLVLLLSSSDMTSVVTGSGRRVKTQWRRESLTPVGKSRSAVSAAVKSSAIRSGNSSSSTRGKTAASSQSTDKGKSSKETNQSTRRGQGKSSVPLSAASTRTPMKTKSRSAKSFIQVEQCEG